MTLLSAGLTNGTAPFFSHVIAVTMNHKPCVHLGPPNFHYSKDGLRGRQHIIWTVHADDSSTIA
jgi:hypothetical protein